MLAEVLREQEWLLPSLECRLMGARAALRTRRHGHCRVTRRRYRRGARVPGRPRNACAAGTARRWAALRPATAPVPCRRSGPGSKSPRTTGRRLGLPSCAFALPRRFRRLADLGLDLAFESRRAVEVLRWSERWRAGALRAPRGDPSDGREARVDARRRCGTPSLASSAPRSKVVTSGRSLHNSEGSRRRSASAAAPRRGTSPKLRVSRSPAELREAIGERALVEYIEHDGRLHAVTGTRRRFDLRCLGSAAEVATERCHAAVRSSSPRAPP